ncbi:unnamed protein product [Didymodactylos carnosus]|uniref:Uncharacterized protein n=1 Tax=Didymodactylos carnosus TaxID=1234261 RepID=A0A815GC52_9BILA|nr:unnamed protein product [Didymodactylos carnosus]CAF4196245.1 unnamed protein product [Didymodactylos carnosus]
MKYSQLISFFIKLFNYTRYNLVIKKDIAQISGDWMKQFCDQNIRIIRSVGQQDDRNLSTILIELLNEYKQDEKLTIVPLNIAGIHGIPFALIFNKKPIYKYNLKEFDNNIKGKHLIDILTSSSFFSENLTKQVHDLATFQTFNDTYDKNFEQLKADILDLNFDQKISFL